MKETLSTEIERKFVVTELPPDIHLGTYPSAKISQGYLAHSDNSVVRLRQKGDHYFLTYKRDLGRHSAERVELECQLTEEQFAILWPGTAGRRLEKTRYEIPLGDHIIELDIFEGDNAGHILAEVEFTSIANADAFRAPNWFGPDVTADDRYGNANIAEHGFPSVN